MEFVPAICPKCGGELMLPKNKEEAFCLHCGNKFIISDNLKKATPTIENWLKLARDTFNSRKSLEYCEKIIDVDAENWEAWWLKGFHNAEIILKIEKEESTFLPLDEVLNCFLKARKYGIEKIIPSIENKIMEYSHSILDDIFQKEKEYVSDICGLGDQLFRIENQDGINFVEGLKTINSDDEKLIEFSINYCIMFLGQMENNNVKLTFQQKENVLLYFNRNIEALRKTNPKYTPPEINVAGFTKFT